MADVSVDIELVTSAFNKALKQAGDNIQGFQVQVQKTERGVSTSFKRIDDSAEKAAKSFTVLRGSVASFVGNLSANAVLGLVSAISSATTAVADFGRASVQASIDSQETRSKFQTVFQSIGQEAEKTADTLAKSFGLGAVEARKLLAATGDLLTGFGFTQESALDLSSQVQELAVDLVSFTNFSGGAEAASQALTKALLGERESVKSLGISIQEKDVLEQVAINRANGLTFATERQAKAQATLDIAIKQSQNAIGDYSRTSTSAANQIRLFETRVADLQEQLGVVFVPLVRSALLEINRFLESLDPAKLQAFASEGLNFITQNIQFLGQVIITVDQTISRFRLAFIDLGNIVDRIKFNFADFGITVLETAKAVAAFADIDTTGFDGLIRKLEVTKTLTELNKQENDRATEAIIANTERRNTAVQSVVDTVTKVNKEVAASNQSAEQIEAARLQRQKEKAAQAELTKQQAIKDVKTQFAEEEKIAEIDKQIALEEASEADIERLRELELRKIEIVRQAELDKASAITDATEKAKAVETANQKARVAAIKANNKSEIALEKQKQQTVTSVADIFNSKRNQNLKSSLGTIATLQSNSNKKLFAIGKAAALSQATIDGVAAVQKALTATIPPFNFALAALVGVASAANIAKIASAQPPSAGSFQDGGIVGGNSFSGDNLTANVNSGELILNRSQQQRLFNIANGQDQGTSSEGLTAETVRDIVETTVREMQVVLVADDTEIARSASRGVDNGIIIAGT